jgi:hypothetical protein
MNKEYGGILLIEPDRFRAGQVRNALEGLGLTVVARASSLSGARYAIDSMDLIGFNAVVTYGDFGKKGMGKGGIEDGLKVASMMGSEDPSIPTLLYTNVSQALKPIELRRVTHVVKVESADDLPRLVNAARGLPRLLRV